VYKRREDRVEVSLPGKKRIGVGCGFGERGTMTSPLR